MLNEAIALFVLYLVYFFLLCGFLQLSSQNYVKYIRVASGFCNLEVDIVSLQEC